jgi:hypothetical protein
MLSGGNLHIDSPVEREKNTAEIRGGSVNRHCFPQNRCASGVNKVDCPKPELRAAGGLKKTGYARDVELAVRSGLREIAGASLCSTCSSNK